MANKEIKPKNQKQKSHYFKDMKAELKKVIWPTPKQLISNTVGVIAFTLVIAVIVVVLDVCFDAVSKYGITPVQEKIQSSYGSSEDNEEADSEEKEDESDTNTQVEATVEDSGSKDEKSKDQQ